MQIPIPVPEDELRAFGLTEGLEPFEVRLMRAMSVAYVSGYRRAYDALSSPPGSETHG